ncbi:hypothetical protein Y88_1133 [Novosphingobium nitrogenifigens DSM 19370]|uniref:DUF2182 domain-containing protein n=1 Tax=Novosphingobium nitrogenifigens DSM 19370 TaxID=983920 RepID=F1Z8F4_9SPHN|nr:DUF2182 domain-containing protein [Novosphingobium nitrogenifigens]EGD59071.1 hypothetical protein Y88_1133 [Novosphingobium nitrogenifigens DSM 19370]
MEQVAQPRQSTTGTLALATLVLGAIVFGIEAPHVLPLARVRALGLTEPTIAFALFVLDWTVMCVAMMLPSAFPLLQRVAAIPDEGVVARVASCTLGFIAVWSLAGVALRLAGLLALPPAETAFGPDRATIWLAVAALGGSGAYLLSPFALTCATACRTPMTFIDRHWGRPRPAWQSALVIGIDYGRSCLGCCWPLMLAMSLFALHGAGPMLVATLAMLALKQFANRPLLKALGAALALVALLVGTGSLALPGQAGVLSRGVAFCLGR